MTSKHSLSKLEFAAFLQYSSHGTSSVSVRSQDVIKKLKRWAPSTVDPLIRRLDEARDGEAMTFVFPRDVILVPVPRSGVLIEGALWPALELSKKLVSLGLGKEVLPCLKRIKPVPKAAVSKPKERPTVEMHFDSIEVASSLFSPQNVTLVDDVVTRGATLFGSACLLKEAFPKAEIKAFALVRTISDGEILGMQDPVTGTIEYRNGDTYRRP